MWYNIWKESDKPRSGLIFQLFRSTKKNYLNLTEKLKSEEADEVSEQAAKDPNVMWRLFKRSQTSAKTCSSDIPEDEWVKHYSAVFGSKDLSLEQDCDKCLDEKLKTLLKVQNTFVILKLAVVKIVRKLKH